MKAGIVAGILFGIAATSHAEFRVPGFELVYSYPVETTLEEPDLRRAHEVWPEMIDAAKGPLDIEEFYIVNSTGGYLEPTIRAIERAAKRGVRVRFLMEKKFFKIDPASPASFARLQATPGVEARALEWSQVNGDGIIHAKYFVVDSKAAYVGSQNFDWRSLEHIHELGLKTDDAGVVAQAQAVFEHDWTLSLSSGIVMSDYVERPRAERSKRGYLVSSPWRLDPPGVGDSETELVELIGGAMQEVRIQLLDYNAQTRGKPPRFWASVDNALRDAALRGVRVKLLVSHWNQDPHSLPHIKSLAMIHNVEVRILTVPDPASWPAHVPFTRTIHSKYMTVDGSALWLGTSNWAGGYLTDSRNVELVVRDAELAKRVERIHAHLWESPYAAALDPMKDYPFPRR